tara:strand:- start:458 stop:676 length:219 start_codon:yes stop_codon:yes gene_type:complete
VTVNISYRQTLTRPATPAILILSDSNPVIEYFIVATVVAKAIADSDGSWHANTPHKGSDTSIIPNIRVIAIG